MFTRVVHCKRESYDIYIGRPGPWGNPFVWEEYMLAPFDPTYRTMFLVGSRDEAVDKYEEWIKTKPELLARLPELKGKVLGCWCAPQRCHGDVLVKLIEAL